MTQKKAVIKENPQTISLGISGKQVLGVIDKWDLADGTTIVRVEVAGEFEAIEIPLEMIGLEVPDNSQGGE